MKKIIKLLVIPLVVLVSCNQKREEIAKKNFEIYFKKDMNDPESFELVDMSTLDTLYLTKDEEYDLWRKTMLEPDSIVKKHNDSIEVIKSQRKKNGDFKNFSTIIKIRGKNFFGAKILKSYRVRFDKDMNIIQNKEIKD